MKVILLSDVVQGRRGEVIEAKPGFAMNFLIPRGLAAYATDANMHAFDQQRHKIDARNAEERDQAAQLATEIDGMQIEVKKRVTEADTLYGSVTGSEIGDALEAKGYDFDRRRIQLGAGIKTVGEHEVIIRLHPDVEAAIKVLVVPEE